VTGQLPEQNEWKTKGKTNFIWIDKRALWKAQIGLLSWTLVQRIEYLKCWFHKN